MYCRVVLCFKDTSLGISLPKNGMYLSMIEELDSLYPCNTHLTQQVEIVLSQTTRITCNRMMLLLSSNLRVSMPYNAS